MRLGWMMIDEFVLAGFLSSDMACLSFERKR
jgi:hypothetical protein